jgi:hypothetical protein
MKTKKLICIYLVLVMVLTGCGQAKRLTTGRNETTVLQEQNVKSGDKSIQDYSTPTDQRLTPIVDNVFYENNLKVVSPNYVSPAVGILKSIGLTFITIAGAYCLFGVEGVVVAAEIYKWIFTFKVFGLYLCVAKGMILVELDRIRYLNTI